MKFRKETSHRSVLLYDITDTFVLLKLIPLFFLVGKLIPLIIYTPKEKVSGQKRDDSHQCFFVGGVGGGGDVRINVNR